MQLFIKDYNTIDKNNKSTLNQGNISGTCKKNEGIKVQTPTKDNITFYYLKSRHVNQLLQ